jgi:uncharacterized protein YeaO (DUF488 family)
VETSESQARRLASDHECSASWEVTLIYSSHDTEHNNAVALQEFLKRRSKKRVAA